jgi:FtsP/CotA-like multicopper oxidase with cupredoxin domain
MTDDPLSPVFAQTVKTLKGFDPLQTLTAFEWGETSKAANGQTVRSYQITARDVALEIAPGIVFDAWTYNGTVPGPTLRCRAGDRLRIQFRNQSEADHTMHFHGIHPIAMDGVLPLVRPGGEFIYEFDAEPPGLHLYHCHVPPVAHHMSRGMFGVFIVDPVRPLPPANEMVMVMHGWDINSDRRNEIYALNGCANFYRDHPIAIRRDERVRLYVVSALEYDPIISFHIHGNFFRQIRMDKPEADVPWEDTITLAQAQRSVLEFSYRFPGQFMFHPHMNEFAERGCMGHFQVS